MGLDTGADTIVNDCLNVQEDEDVVIVNDTTDEALLNALQDAVQDAASAYDYYQYPEPETHGAEPPEHVAAALPDSDVFIAPTQKSLSHTRARRKACENGARGATLPGITQEIWEQSLVADYSRVAELSYTVFDAITAADTVHITTPSGTDVTVEIDPEYWLTDTGLIHNPGDFGNLPAGEAFGAPVEMNGTLVVDHFPFAPQGTTIEIADNRAVAVKHPEAVSSELADTFDSVPGARQVAELGIGTNPEAALIGNILQDEKVLGTVHIAFGDNSSMVPDDEPLQNECDMHWDTVCEQPTVTVDETVLIDAGEPQFT